MMFTSLTTSLKPIYTMHHSCGVRKTNARVANSYVYHANTFPALQQSFRAIACLAAAVHSTEIAHKSPCRKFSFWRCDSLATPYFRAAVLRYCEQHLTAVARNIEIRRRRQLRGCPKADVNRLYCTTSRSVLQKSCKFARPSCGSLAYEREITPYCCLTI